MQENYVVAVKLLKEFWTMELTKESTFAKELQLGVITPEELDNTLNNLLGHLSIDIITRLPIEIIQALIVGARKGTPHDITLAYMLAAPVSLEALEFVSDLFLTPERKLH